MTWEKFTSLTEFILENRGNSAFMLMTADDIKDYIVMALNQETIVLHLDKAGNFDGILCWNIKDYFPLTIEVTQAIAKGKNVLIEMFIDFTERMPASFRCMAKRKKASKTINYINPKRLLRLLQRISYYGR
jgi:hypothetical protein